MALSCTKPDAIQIVCVNIYVTTNFYKWKIRLFTVLKAMDSDQVLKIINNVWEKKEQ